MEAVFPPERMKDFVEIDISTRRKKLIYYLLFTLMISKSSKISLTQKNTVSVVRKFVCTSRIKDIEKYTFTIRKHVFHFKKYLKKLKILVSTSRNMVRL